MKPGGRQPEQLVPDAHGRAVDEPRALDDTDRKAGEVVLARRVTLAVLGHLTAHQGAARLATTLRDPADDDLDLGRVDATDRDVVEEVERLGAVDEDVVDPHRDQVDPHGVVAPGQESPPYLRPHPLPARP